jgi:glycosyltransferase involved in cell wall biosynthesis
MTPRVSVIIPLYNKARHIARAINSVLSQTVADFELIVVDDGSTDSGGGMVRDLADPRLRLIAQDNAGPSAARNRGIQEASGEVVAFLDADDEWMPGFLETVMDLRNRCPDAGMFATAYRCSRGCTVWRPQFIACPESLQGGLIIDYFRAGLGPAPVTSSSVMIPKGVLDEIGGFPVSCRHGSDLPTWARIALRYRVAWSPLDGVVYHLSADNRIGDMNVTSAEVPVAAVIEPFLQAGLDPVSSRRMVEEYLVQRRLLVVLNAHLSGQRAWALALLKNTRHTTLFRKKRLLLQCLVRIPPEVLKWGLALKAFLRSQCAGARQQERMP